MEKLLHKIGHYDKGGVLTYASLQSDSDRECHRISRQKKGKSIPGKENSLSKVLGSETEG